VEWRPGETLWLDVAGKHLEARVWGPSPTEAPTLFLLHEGLGSLSLWRDFPEALTARTGCGVFAWSRAGYGASDPVDLPRPLDYMEREGREVLPLILNTVNPLSAVLIGHSDGASIAAVGCAHAQDPRIKGLCLIAPHFFTEDRALASISKAKEAYRSGDLRDRLARHHRDVDNAFCGWNDAWLDPGFKTWNIESCLPLIPVPVLALQGREDQYGTLAQIDAIKRGLRTPLTTTILENCRHAPHAEQRETTLAAISKFTTASGF